MEDIPMQGRMEDRTFDHDESDYLLSPPSEENVSYRRNNPRKKNNNSCGSCCCSIFCCWRKKELKSRTIWIGKKTTEHFPPNRIRNQKYNIFTFLPKVLFQQFKFFLNLYFLIMACSQFIPELRIGYLYTYWGPLGFVISVTMIREAIDDIRRWQRDREVNLTRYAKLTDRGLVSMTSSNLRVGDIVVVEKGVRVPADLVLLRTTET